MVWPVECVGEAISLATSAVAAPWPPPTLRAPTAADSGVWCTGVVCRTTHFTLLMATFSPRDLTREARWGCGRRDEAPWSDGRRRRLCAIDPRQPVVCVLKTFSVAATALNIATTTHTQPPRHLSARHLGYDLRLGVVK